jgi:hypothetical protein
MYKHKWVISCRFKQNFFEFVVFEVYLASFNRITRFFLVENLRKVQFFPKNQFFMLNSPKQIEIDFVSIFLVELAWNDPKISLVFVVFKQLGTYTVMHMGNTFFFKLSTKLYPITNSISQGCLSTLKAVVLIKIGTN